MPQTISKRNRRNKKRGDTTRQDVSKFAGDAYDLGRRAIQGVKYLKNLINIETKVYDNIVSVAPAAWAVTLLSTIPTGVTGTTRVGNSIKLQRILMRVQIDNNGAAITAGRLVLFRDNDCLAVAPTAAEIFNFTTQALNCIALPEYVSVDSQRFGILGDWTYSVNGTDPIQFFTADIPHVGHIKFRGANGAIADMGNGALFLAHAAASSAGAPSLNGCVRILFTDD
jgi:hypothetical protein